MCKILVPAKHPSASGFNRYIVCVPVDICHANDYEKQNHKNAPDGIKTDIPIYHQYPKNSNVGLILASKQKERNYP